MNDKAEWEIIKTSPVICYDCIYSNIVGDKMYCLREKRIVYSARPKWCPIPLYRNKKTGETE